MATANNSHSLTIVPKISPEFIPGSAFDYQRWLIALLKFFDKFQVAFAKHRIGFEISKHVSDMIQVSD